MPLPHIVQSNNEFIAFGRLLVSDRPGSDVAVRDGLAISWADSPSVFFNLIFLAEPVADGALLAARLRTVAEYLRSKEKPGLFLMCDDYLDGTAHAHLDVALAEAGLVSALETTGMSGDLLTFDEPVDHPDLCIERVSGERAIRYCAQINSEAYGLPPEPMLDGLTKAARWNERVFCFVGFHGDRAVTTASVVEGEGTLYMAYVATLPDAQRKGFSEATMRRALMTAHEATGVSRTALHASAAGYPLYERMGYTAVTRIIGYGLADAAHE